MQSNFRINNYRLWIFIALIIKGIFFWLQVYSNSDTNQPLWGFFTHDSHEYYDSMNRFYETGVYTPDVRMPGLGILFLPLRFFFERNMVLDIILILQWAVASVAIYVLALTMFRITKKKNVFYITFFLIALTHYIFLWDALLLTESFCISFFIFSLFFLKCFIDRQTNKFIFLAGFFLTWCVFLRPVFFLFYGILFVFLFLYFIKSRVHLKQILIYTVLFVGLFVILDSIWTIRNYKVKKKFIFLNDISSYSELNPIDPLPAVYLFLEAWGGDLENKHHWFEMEKDKHFKYRDTVLPDYIYTSKFNKDSLILVKERIKIYRNYRLDSIVGLINTSLQNYTNSIREEKPFLYYFGAGFINLKEMMRMGYWNHDQINDDFGKLPFITKVYRLERAIVFYLLFFTGFIYSFFYFFSKNKDSLMKALIIIAHANLYYIAFFFRTAEFRYVLPSSLVFFCLSVILINNLWERYRKKPTSLKL